MSDAPRIPTLVEPGSLTRELGERFDAAGHELWLVGGSVRDYLMQRPPAGTELDLATDAKPTRVLEIIRPLADRVWLQGVRFGTVGAGFGDADVEITTYREEWYPPDSRKPQVHFARDVHSDLSRRDFTVNAIAVRTPTGEVLDEFGGIQDLSRRVLRTPRSPEQAFTDDPLRMLRACRFAAVLDFEVADEVLHAIRAMADRLDIVSRERIRDELSKLLVGEKPSRGLDAMVSTGLSRHVIPELDALEMEQDPIHRHKDVLRHTYAVVEGVPPRLVPRLGALLHDIGKPATREFGPEGVTFHHHEVVGARMAVDICKRLRFSNDVVDDVRRLVFLHLRFHTYRLGWTDSAVRRYVRDAGHLLDELNALVRADCTTRNRRKAEMLQRRMDELEERIADLAEREELAKMRPPLDGHHVMAFFDVGPSKVVGDALGFLLELRLERGPMGPKEAFAELERWGRERDLEPIRTPEEAMEVAAEAQAEAEDDQTDGSGG